MPSVEEIGGKAQIPLRVLWWGLSWLQLALARGLGPFQVPFEEETGERVQLGILVLTLQQGQSWGQLCSLMDLELGQVLVPFPGPFEAETGERAQLETLVQILQQVLWWVQTFLKMGLVRVRVPSLGPSAEGIAGKEQTQLKELS